MQNIPSFKLNLGSILQNIVSPREYCHRYENVMFKGIFGNVIITTLVNAHPGPYESTVNDQAIQLRMNLVCH